MQKIYTKTGDDGTTAIIGGLRVSKCDARIEAIGSIDELNANIGILLEDSITGALHESRYPLLIAIQNDLFTIGAQLADTQHKNISTTLFKESTLTLEQKIDTLAGRLPELKNFILPSGTSWAAKAHMARAVCRRAERKLTELNSTNIKKSDPKNTEKPITIEILSYINRLSDLLFMLAREDVAANNGREIIWHQ